MRLAIRGLTGLALAAACACVAAQPAPGDVTVTSIVTSGLSQPVGVFNAADGSNRLFVTQRTGAVRVVRDGVLVTTPFLTIDTATQCRETVGGALQNTGFVTANGEQGLFAVAFHPSFEANGRFFVSYTGANGDTLVTSYTMADPTLDVAGAADQQTCLVVLRVDQDFANHNGGNIVFGPDGFLYFGLGDGGMGNDLCDRGLTLSPAEIDGAASGGTDLQSDGECDADTGFLNAGGNPDSRALLGKMLRLDVDGTTPAGANELCGSRGDGAANYAVPASNPFAQGDALGRCDEVYSYGLRNPWRWSFDRDTDDLILADVGQDQWEEVNFLSAASGAGLGVNFDWKTCEGRHVRNSCTTLCTSTGADTSEVIIAYNNSGGCPGAPTPVTGCSITGGYRYRGQDPLLQGVYFYGDACGSNIYYSVDTGGNTWVAPSASTTLANAAGGGVVAFGEDEFGSVYVLGGSRLSRIGAAPVTDILFRDGFE